MSRTPHPRPARRVWHVMAARDPYTAPELRRVQIVGVPSSGHNAGHRIITSPIVTARGRVVTTESGSTYELGRASPKYLAWLKEQRIPYDTRQPIRVRPRK